MTIPKKDIVTFGKVLSKLGQCIEKNPEKILELLNNIDNADNTDNTVQKNKHPSEVSFLVENEIRTAENIREFLSAYKMEDLKNFIKERHYGVPAKPNKQKLIDCIARNVEKTKKDVFLEYETSVEKEKF